jgi:hypothetical protein
MNNTYQRNNFSGLHDEKRTQTSKNWPTQHPMQRVLGVERPRHEADHSPPSSMEVKNGGDIPSLPQRLHGVVFN